MLSNYYWGMPEEEVMEQPGVEIGWYLGGGWMSGCQQTDCKFGVKVDSGGGGRGKGEMKRGGGGGRLLGVG